MNNSWRAKSKRRLNLELDQPVLDLLEQIAEERGTIAKSLAETLIVDFIGPIPEPEPEDG